MFSITISLFASSLARPSIILSFSDDVGTEPFLSALLSRLVGVPLRCFVFLISPFEERVGVGVAPRTGVANVLIGE